MRKGYSNGPFDQIYWRMSEPVHVPSKPDLYCLHPALFSGLAFTAIMPHLAEGRRVIAPDYPGHGGSDIFKSQPAILEYAEAMLALTAELSQNIPVDVMGFRTGNLVAVEMSLAAPTSIGKLALPDVTSRATDLIAHAKLTERLEIKRAVLDEAACETAHEILKFLDRDSL